jgi:hypothetical protein
MTMSHTYIEDAFIKMENGSMKCEMHCKDKKDDLVEYDAANKIWIHR